MKTIYAGLPFYSAASHQDRYRTNGKIPFYCPPTHLPPFVVCDVVANEPTILSIYLTTCEGTETNITAYFSATADIVVLTDDFYIIYDGTALSTSLPFGTYYLRVETDAGYSYYSELFMVTDMTARKWMKLEFDNTNDLGDIPYSQGFTQIIYLNTQLNFPLNEVVEVGEEKDGEFIAEKVVTKYLYRISDYVCRPLHRVLIRLPQHDNITITDEVGNTYTPAVGNVAITTAEWVNFDVCHMVIQFNDGDNTAFDWTYDMADMT